MNWANVRRVRLRTLFARRDLTGRPDLPMLSVYRDYGVVPREGRDDNYNKPGENLGAYRVVRRGDLVLNKMKTWQGSLGISQYDGIVSPAYFVARPLTDDCPEFLHHLLRSSPLIAEYGARSKGIRPAQWDLPWEEFRNITVNLPPAATQRCIADYLDRETVRIDALIAAKQRMVELLEERRRALRDNAFGSEPGWRLKRLLADSMAYGVLVPEFVAVGEGVPMIRTYNLSAKGRVTHEDIAEIPVALAREYRRTSLHEGDVILSVVGSMGRSAVVSSAEHGFNLNRPLARLQFRAEVPPRLIWHWIQTTHFMDMAKLSTGGGTAQPTLNLGDLANFTVGLPREAELWPEVLAELEEMCGRLDEMEVALDQQIKLLQERRRALITAAVTGQLDIPEAA